MDPEMEVTSAAEGVPEIEVTSAAEGVLEIEVTSAAEGVPEIEVTSATEGVPEIEVTSAAEGVPEIEVTSAAEGPEAEGTIDTTSSKSIFRAPAHIRYGRESYFEPKFVSIGPYYYGRENLTKSQKLKVQCSSDLMKNKAVGDSNIDRVSSVDTFKRFEGRARDFYKEKFDYINHDDFVGMLVLDSCFIIRIMLSLSQEVKESMAFLDVNIKEVISDLLLLENQIPLFFIHTVYKWLFPNDDKKRFPSFLTVLESFIHLDLPWQINSASMWFKTDHLLDYYWRASASMQVSSEQMQTSWAEKHRSASKLIENATELHQMAGIKFEKHNDPNIRGLSVKFSKGIMQMPYLKINSSQITLFVNLIAFENSKQLSIRTISTYIKFMDDLIDSKKDVDLLQKSGIIYNTLSSHTEAATFFNDIGNFCSIDYKTNNFSNVFRDVEKYYESSWNRRWASLRQNYFNSTWAGISVLAGGTLLILTVLQTFYTLYGYYNPRN